MKSAPTARHETLPNLHSKYVEKIRKNFGGDCVWISVDQSTDRKGRPVSTFVVGNLENPKIGPHLLNIEKADGHASIDLEAFIIKSLNILYPDFNGNYILAKIN